MMQLTALPPLNVPSPVAALLSADGGLYAGGIGGIAYFDGAAWTPRISGLTLTSVTVLAQAGRALIAGGTDGLARSEDGGISWQPCPIAGGTATISALAVSPTDDKSGIVIAASLNMGILRSDDGGKRWEVSAFGLQSYEVLALIWTADGALIAGTTDGLYRSPNFGRAWKLERECDPVTALTQMPNGDLLAALETGALLVSRDRGVTWTPQSSTLPEGTEITALAGAFMGTSGGVYSTADGGATWTHELNGAVFSLARDDAGHLFAGIDGDVWRRADGSWTPLPVPPLHDLRRVLMIGDAVIVAGRLSAMLRFDGAGWHTVSGAPLPLSLLTRHKDALYASGVDGLLRSDDGGATWQEVWRGAHLSQLAFQPNGVTFGSRADGSQLVRTTDGGVTWQATKSPFRVLPVVTLQATDTLIFAGVFDARRRVIALWRSTDGGARWFPGAEVPSEWGIAASFPDPAMIALPGAVLVSGAAPGDAWERARFDVPDVYVRTFAGDPAVQFALTLTNGVFVSRDRGRTWTRLPLDLPADHMMDISYDAGRLAVLLVGGRVYVVE
jgi:photosystem II stability/assembly factor-like uncharacterized protein